VAGSLTFVSNWIDFGSTYTLAQAPIARSSTTETYVYTRFTSSIHFASLEVVIGETPAPLPTGAYQPTDFTSFTGAAGTFLADLYCGGDDFATACLEYRTPASNSVVAASGTVVVSAVPEPTTISLTLIGVGSLGLVMALRKRLAKGLPIAT
jgi:PEP-CTERM motif